MICPRIYSQLHFNLARWQQNDVLEIQYCELEYTFHLPLCIKDKDLLILIGMLILQRTLHFNWWKSDVYNFPSKGFSQSINSNDYLYLIMFNLIGQDLLFLLFQNLLLISLFNLYKSSSLQRLFSRDYRFNYSLLFLLY